MAEVVPPSTSRSGASKTDTPTRVQPVEHRKRIEGNERLDPEDREDPPLVDRSREQPVQRGTEMIEVTVENPIACVQLHSHRSQIVHNTRGVTSARGERDEGTDHRHDEGRGDGGT